MQASPRLTAKEIGRLVHNWIGVDGGYLGRCSYASHDRFWMETCDLHVDTAGFPGTTRACFEATLASASARDQAAALRAILEEYPPADAPDPNAPKFRSAALHKEIVSWISRLETGQIAVEIESESASDVVRRALDDAGLLLRGAGPESVVDRVHTAMHGYLHSLAAEAEAELGERPSMNQLLKAILAQHPAFAELGPRSEEIERVLRALGTILDALNPVRNNASVAHPNAMLLEPPEAMLVVNTVRTLELPRGSTPSGVGRDQAVRTVSPRAAAAAQFARMRCYRWR